MSDIHKTASVNVVNPSSSPSPQPSWIPGQKVLAGGLAGLIAFGITWAVQHYAGITLDPQLQTALVSGITIAMTYLTPVGAKDVVRSLNNEIVAMAQADPNSPVTAPVVVQKEAVPVIVSNQIPGEKGTQE